MSVFGSPIVQGPAGLNQAQRTAVREAEAKKQSQRPARARGADEVEVQNAQTTDAVRGLTGNGQEETKSDRRRQSDAPQTQPRKPLDLQG